MFFGCILFLNNTKDFNQDLRANVNRAVGIQGLSQGPKPNSDTETNGKHKRKQAKGSQEPIHTPTKVFWWNKTTLPNNKNNRPTLTKTSLEIVLLNEWVE